MSDVRKPVNTTERERSSGGMGMLAESMAVGTSAAIEGQEAAGQREMLFSDVIPYDGCVKGTAGEKELEALGFKLGEPPTGDEIFRECELPEGWSREGSSHSMWTFVVDERGFRRVACFYKAAFYDRSAHCSVEREPKTAAQADAISPFYDEFGGFPKNNIRTSMDGDVLVLIAQPLQHGEDGKPIRAGDEFESGWLFADVDPVERRIAMDGSET
jgi:hypothetical protein